MIDLPVRFPTQEETIAEEVANFRALSPEQRVHSVAQAFNLYHFLAQQSRKRARLQRLADEEEAQAANAIRAFVSRHAS